MKIVDEWNECESCGHEHEKRVGIPCPKCGHTKHYQVVEYADGTTSKG
jgi:predicted RNA-binding Zn-ribbon protein involved in translation (DUF1610 family)